MNFLGFTFKRNDTAPSLQPTFSPPEEDDGAVNVVAAGGAYGTYLDLDGTAKNESELINQYREMSMHHDVENAIDDVVNEAISFDHTRDIIKIIVDDVPYSENIRRLIMDEFDTILQLLDFSNQAYDIFRRWYIDGRINFHVLIDQEDPTNGITELRYIDPRKIRKIRELGTIKDPNTGVDTIQTVREYFIYNESGFGARDFTGTQAGKISLVNQQVIISPDAIVNVTSGLTDATGQMVISHLHKAVKPLNVLRALEDATVIYTVARAPERRIFYIDVGNLPKQKAEQYLRDMMIKHKNKLVYDATTGAIRDDRKIMTMLEDYWLARRDGQRGTEIDTLPGGQNIGEMDHVVYFQKNLYKALNVPISRTESDGTYALGRATEISRDEIKFSKFISRLRQRFSLIFSQLLEKQLVLRRILTIEEWQNIKNRIRYDFINDNYFAELRDLDILKEKIIVVQMLEQAFMEGKYYSRDWIKKNILGQNEEEIIDMQKQIDEEQSDDLAKEIASTQTKLSAFPQNPELAGADPLPKEKVGNPNYD